MWLLYMPFAPCATPVEHLLDPGFHERRHDQLAVVGSVPASDSVPQRDGQFATVPPDLHFIRVKLALYEFLPGDELACCQTDFTRLVHGAPL